MRCDRYSQLCAERSNQQGPHDSWHQCPHFPVTTLPNRMVSYCKVTLVWGKDTYHWWRLGEERMGKKDLFFDNSPSSYKLPSFAAWWNRLSFSSVDSKSLDLCFCIFAFHAYIFTIERHSLVAWHTGQSINQLHTKTHQLCSLYSCTAARVVRWMWGLK